MPGAETRCAIAALSASTGAGGTFTTMTDRQPSQRATSRSGEVCVWLNRDTAVALSIREKDGSIESSDITHAVAVLVSLGLDARSDDGDGGEDSTVELGYIDLTGTMRVLVDGRRLGEGRALELISGGVVSTIRKYVDTHLRPTAETTTDRPPSDTDRGSR
jgi:hypothetical protein